MISAAIGGCGGSGESTEPTTAGADVVSGDGAPVPEVERTPIEEAGAERFNLSADWLSSAAGSVWASDDSTLKRLDARSGRLMDPVPVPEHPCLGSDTGFGAVWTATCAPGGLTRIDAATGEVSAHVRVSGLPPLEGANGSIGVGEGGVWLVTDRPGCEDCLLLRFDPETLEPTAEIVVKKGAAGVRAGAGSVWVANPVVGVLQQVDPEAEKVVRTTRVEQGPRYLTVGEGSVWTLNVLDGSVTRVDPETADVVATIPAELDASEGDLTTGSGAVWARSASTLLTRIDPDSNEVVEQFGPPASGGGVTVAGHAVWLAAFDRNTIWRLPLPG